MFLDHPNSSWLQTARYDFSELLYQQFDNHPRMNEEVGRMTPLGVRYGVGAKLANTTLQLDAGAIFSVLKES